LGGIIERHMLLSLAPNFSVRTMGLVGDRTRATKKGPGPARGTGPVYLIQRYLILYVLLLELLP
jgi:hypothetical protein